jgi:hypothetical protein
MEIFRPFQNIARHISLTSKGRSIQELDGTDIRARGFRYDENATDMGHFQLMEDNGRSRQRLVSARFAPVRGQRLFRIGHTRSLSCFRECYDFPAAKLVPCLPQGVCRTGCAFSNECGKSGLLADR